MRDYPDNATGRRYKAEHDLLDDITHFVIGTCLKKDSLIHGSDVWDKVKEKFKNHYSFTMPPASLLSIDCSYVKSINDIKVYHWCCAICASFNLLEGVEGFNREEIKNNI